MDKEEQKAIEKSPLHYWVLIFLAIFLVTSLVIKITEINLLIAFFITFLIYASHKKDYFETILRPKNAKP
jgi:hypothetical protein